MKSEIINKPLKPYLCGFDTLKTIHAPSALEAVKIYARINPDSQGYLDQIQNIKIDTFFCINMVIPNNSFFTPGWEWWSYSFPISPSVKFMVKTRLANEAFDSP